MSSSLLCARTIDSFDIGGISRRLCGSSTLIFVFSREVMFHISLLIASGAISTKNIGSGILVCWCFIFTICLTVKPISSSASNISVGSVI